MDLNISTIKNFKGYKFKCDKTGSYHRILSKKEYKFLLNFYKNHVYIGGVFMDSKILTLPLAEKILLSQYEINKADEILKILQMWGFSKSGKLDLFELGCGYGAFLAKWKIEGFGIAKGIDISPIAVKLGKQLFSVDIDCETVLASNIFKKGYYDLVAALDFIEHVFDLNFLINSITKLMKPKGKVLIEVPIISKNWSWQQVTTFKYMHPKHHIHLFTPEGIKNLFEQKDFRLDQATFLEERQKYLILFRR